MARRKKETPAYVLYYREVKHPAAGIAASILGVLSLFLLAALTWLTVRLGDKAGAWIGAAGFTAFALAFVGLVYGLSSFHVRCRSYFFSRAGTLLCGFMVAAWFLLFCVGLAGG